ncbi:hypothetical protein SLA2020_461960 [Shorea laevis]
MIRAASCSSQRFCNSTNRLEQNPLFLYRLITRTRLSSVHSSHSSFQFHAHLNLDSFVSALINGISSCSRVPDCQAFHARVIKSVNYRHGFIGDQLVSGYVRLGCEEDAQNWFDEMPEKDLASWNSLISVFSRSGYKQKCLVVFSRMRFQTDIQPNYITFLSLIPACTYKGALSEGKCIHSLAMKLGMLSEVKIVNAFINLYGKSGHLEAASRLFEAVPLQNLVSWNSVIVVYTENGFAEKGIIFFTLLRRAEVKFDQATLLIVLQACECLGVGNVAGSIHGLILSFGLNSNITIATALLNLYAKLGRLSSSREVFREMVYPDMAAWTAILASYAMHGHGKEAIQLFELMVKKGVQPDHVTFTHLLSACSHSGLVDEGKHYFRIMSDIYGIECRLDHYSCMVDLLGRSGQLKDAYELIKGMPVEPNSGVWGALLGACRIYGNVELGREVAERLFTLDPSDARNYIMLSNIYSAAGQWIEASKVRALMKERGFNRTPGYSFIEHKNKIHYFVVGDRSHPETDKIYAKLEELIEKIRKTGFVPKTEFVLHDVEEEVKEDMINKHSEKLAIAFGLLVTNDKMPFIITKNLRICGDCHGTAKLISLIEKRTIIIRDPKRFHHFANGICSCGDYW